MPLDLGAGRCRCGSGARCVGVAVEVGPVVSVSLWKRAMVRGAWAQALAGNVFPVWNTVPDGQALRVPASEGQTGPAADPSRAQRRALGQETTYWGRLARIGAV